MIACKKCGNVNADGVNFCERCGSFLEWTGEPVDEEPGSTYRQPTRDKPPKPPPIPSPRFNLVIADLEPDRLDVEAGGQVAGVIRVRNASGVVDAITFELQGEPAAWASVEPQSVNLYPGTEGSARIVFRVPRGPGSTAGPHPFGVALHSHANPDSSVVISGVLNVMPFDALSVTVTPQRARGRRRTAFRVGVRNEGNHPARVRLEVTDPDGLLKLAIRPATIDVEPGATAAVSVGVAAGSWIWFGSPQNRTVQFRAFQVSPRPGESDRLIAEAVATFVQIPVFRRWILLPLAAIGVLLLASAAAGGGQCLAWLQPDCPPAESGSPGETPGSSIAQVSPGVTDDASAGVSADPSAGVTADPTTEVTSEPTAEVTPEPTPCTTASGPNAVVFDCLPGGATGTMTYPFLTYQDSGIQLFFYPENPQTECAVNGALAILVAGDPGTGLGQNVLAPAHKNDPRACNDFGLEFRLEDPVQSMTIEVPAVGEQYGATVWDQGVQNQLGIFQGPAQRGTDGLIAFRFTASNPFHEVFLSRLPDGERLFVQSIRFK